MNNAQIDRILRRVMGVRFRGVFPADGIPPISGPFPYAMVVNTDKRGQPGRHWQAVWVNSGGQSAEFFDSFGDSPSGVIANYLHSLKIKENNKKVQANYEVSCGPFVIYYLIQKARRFQMADIVKKLSNRPFVDSFVKLFVLSLV